LRETNRNTWSVVSATEWAASARRALDPDSSPANSLATARVKLAATAMRTVFLLSDAMDEDDARSVLV
jgi:hypothetical protein